jgi:hypothetical protein
MRRRLVAVVVGAVLLVSADAALAAVPSELTIRWNATAENFNGRVRSSNDECKAHRVVKVYRRTPSGASLQGRVMTNARGRWRFHAMDAHGRFFGVTPRYEAMGDTVCRRDRSRTIDVM